MTFIGLILFYFFTGSKEESLLHGGRECNQPCYLQDMELPSNAKGIKRETITKQNVVKLQEGRVLNWPAILIKRSLNENGYRIF